MKAMRPERIIKTNQIYFLSFKTDVCRNIKKRSTWYSPVQPEKRNLSVVSLMFCLFSLWRVNLRKDGSLLLMITYTWGASTTYCFKQAQNLILNFVYTCGALFPGRTKYFYILSSRVKVKHSTSRKLTDFICKWTSLVRLSCTGFVHF